jgi:hypothetical protein
MVGGSFVGGGSLDGRIAGLAARATAAGVDLSFRHLEVPEGSNHQIAVALDGDLYAFTPSAAGSRQSVSFPATIGDGEHRVSVVPIRGETRRAPDLHGVDYGRRAFLRWPPSPSSDLDSYLVFGNGGSGPVNYSEPIAVVSLIDVHRDWFQAGTGTGSGRLTVGGNWSGERVNQAFTVQTSSGTFRHNLTGSWSAWEPINRGSATLLDFGVVVVFEDDPASYAAKAFEIRVGPLVEWASPELAEGNWLFSVKGRDLAGNLSAALTELPLAIIHRPDAVRNLRATFDPSLSDPIALSWDLPSDPDRAAVDLYCNYSNTFERLGEEIIEDAPWVSLSDDAETYAFAPAVDGVWRFYVRTRDSAGRRSDNVEAVEVDTEGLPTGVRLNAPEQVAVAAGPGGSFVVSWVYRFEGGEDIDGFEVREVGGSVVATSSAVGETIASYSATVAGPYSVATSFVVAALAASGDELLSDEVEGTPDATPPSMPEPLQGVPN